MVKQGIFYDVTEADYHADPCPEPSLSASIIKELLDCPAKAWEAHPRLNPEYKPEEKKEFDLGKAAHAELTMKGKETVVCPFPDWRSKEAREMRDKIYKNGGIPLLEEQAKIVEEMAGKALLQIEEHQDCPDAFTTGKSEVTIIWQEENGVWCRIRVDNISDNGIFYDYKTTSQSANPATAGRLFSNLGYEITAAFYRRGIRKVLGIENPEYRFIVQENSPPYLLSAVAWNMQADEIGDQKVEHAIQLWAKCLKKGEWVGYEPRLSFVGLPAYHELAWTEQKNRSE